MNMKESLSYDDVLLVPAYSEVLPGDVSIKTRLAGDLNLNIPIISAAMDTVTEGKLAIALALEGGAGVIDRNMTPEEQGKQVADVKRYLNWVIELPCRRTKRSRKFAKLCRSTEFPGSRPLIRAVNYAASLPEGICGSAGMIH